MPTSHSLSVLRPWADKDPHRIARAAILNGVPIPAVTVAQLQARGVNVGELEARLRQNMEFVR
jgi:hypothetical protein